VAGDPHRLDDLFHQFGPVMLRRFFGGEAIYTDAVMFGMIFGDVIYFKTDIETRKAFLDERCKPFSFRKAGVTVETGFFAIPERLYDDADELAQWARSALSIATQKPQRKIKQTRKQQGTPRRYLP